MKLYKLYFYIKRHYILTLLNLKKGPLKLANVSVLFNSSRILKDRILIVIVFPRSDFLSILVIKILALHVIYYFLSDKILPRENLVDFTFIVQFIQRQIWGVLKITAHTKMLISFFFVVIQKIKSITIPLDDTIEVAETELRIQKGGVLKIPNKVISGFINIAVILIHLHLSRSVLFNIFKLSSLHPKQQILLLLLR